MSRITFTRVRPTVLSIHAWLGIVVSVCCWHFGPTTESLSVLAMYVIALAGTANNIVKDGDDETAKVRLNIIGLDFIGGLVLIVFTLRYPEAEALVAAVNGFVGANIILIKDLVHDEDKPK